MSKSLKKRMRMPAGEIAHMVHTMPQTVKGLLMGATGKAGTWEDHIFKTASGKSLPFFMRIEFQDGTRRKPLRTTMVLVARISTF